MKLIYVINIVGIHILLVLVNNIDTHCAAINLNNNLHAAASNC